MRGDGNHGVVKVTRLVRELVEEPNDAAIKFVHQRPPGPGFYEEPAQLALAAPICLVLNTSMAVGVAMPAGTISGRFWEPQSAAYAASISARARGSSKISVPMRQVV